MLIKQTLDDGSWFAMIKMALRGTTLSEIKSCGHGYTRRITLLIELLHLFVVIFFTWVAVGLLPGEDSIPV